MTLLSCWILITLLNFDTFLSRNSTGRRYADGSKFHVDLWPRVKVPRWIMTPGQNSTLNFDPDSRSEFNVESWIGVTIKRWIQTWDNNLTLNQDLGHNSTWNIDRGKISTWNLDPGHNSTWKFWPGVTFRRGIMTRGHNSTWKYNPGSEFHVELWSRVRIPHWIGDPNPRSQFNVESWLGVKVQRGMKTWGHNLTWKQDPGSQFNRGSKFYPSEGS